MATHSLPKLDNLVSAIRENIDRKLQNYSNEIRDDINRLQDNVNTLLSSKANSSHTHTKSEITDFPTLATVATSGSYNDLSNKPTIPTYNAGTNLSLSDKTFNVSSTPSFTNITISGYTITVD